MMDYIVVWEFPTTDQNGITANAWVESRHKQLYFCSLYRHHDGRTAKSTKATPINAISDVVIGDDGRYKVKLVKVSPELAAKTLMGYSMSNDDLSLAESFLKVGRACFDGKSQKRLVKIFSKCGFAYNHYVSTDAYEFISTNTKTLPVSDVIFKR
jgi:hypothetical protein